MRLREQSLKNKSGEQLVKARVVWSVPKAGVGPLSAAGMTDLRPVCF